MVHYRRKAFGPTGPGLAAPHGLLAATRGRALRRRTTPLFTSPPRSQKAQSERFDAFDIVVVPFPMQTGSLKSAAPRW